MRICFAFLFLIAAACSQQAATQAPAVPAPQAAKITAPVQFGGSDQPEKWAKYSTGDKLSDMFQQKIRAEWDAIQKKDKKAYGDLLADDYEGVEVDGRGERNKIQAINELVDTNVSNYILYGFSLLPAGPDGDLVIYESTMQFPPKSVVRFSRIYISELWLKRNGEWKIVHYQETHVK